MMISAACRIRLPHDFCARTKPPAVLALRRQRSGNGVHRKLHSPDSAGGFTWKRCEDATMHSPPCPASRLVNRPGRRGEVSASPREMRCPGTRQGLSRAICSSACWLPVCGYVLNTVGTGLTCGRRGRHSSHGVHCAHGLCPRRSGARCLDVQASPAPGLRAGTARPRRAPTARGSGI